MKPVDFDYAAPKSVAEALELLAAWRHEAKILAGGQSLVPLLVARSVRPRFVIDINRVAGLGYIEEREGGLAIGAMVRQADCEASPLVRRSCPLLAEAIRWVATPQVRNRGTVVGSLAQRNAISQIPTVGAAIGGRLKIVGSGNRMRTAETEAFLDASSAATLQPDELVLECWFPEQKPGTAWAFVEVQRRLAHYALVGVAVVFAIDPAGLITDARVAASGVADRPIRLGSVEQALSSRPATREVFAEASRAAVNDPLMDPREDVHATAEYRRAVTPMLVERALIQAKARLEAEIQSGRQ